MKRVLIALAVSVLAGTAHAAPTVLGIQVGAVLTLTKCDFSTQHLPKEPCWAPEPYDPPGQELVREVFLSADNPATFVRNATIIVDGKGAVAGLVLLTSGIDTQLEAVRALEAKFGKPDSYHVDRLQNRMGAKFAGVRAAWHRFGLIVTFDSTAGGELDSGEIDILTPAEAAVQAAHEKAPSL
jgi:hypothetical protein